jgi:low affinity Fe/Cu permease
MAARSSTFIGHPWTFLVTCAVAAVWLAAGPLFGWSGGWLLVPATATSVGAFLLVMLLQYSQNRDTRAIQLKLDELLRSLAEARTHLVGLEQLPDEELERIGAELGELRDEEVEVAAEHAEVAAEHAEAAAEHARAASEPPR